MSLRENGFLTLKNKEIKILQQKEETNFYGHTNILCQIDVSTSINGHNWESMLKLRNKCSSWDLWELTSTYCAYSIY